MATSAEPSSSLSFASPSHMSNGSNISHETLPSLEAMSLNKLSSNLEQLLLDSSCDYSDADVLVEGTHVGVHRCILAARSGFFHDLFKKDKVVSEKEGGKPTCCMKDLLPYGSVGYEAFLVFLGYVYAGKLKPFPMEVSTCVDNICAHDSCRPAINFAVELTYASSIFQMPELVSLFQRRLVNFVGKSLVEDVIPILVVAFHCQLSQLFAQCIDRVARSDLETVYLEKELPSEVAENIKKLRRKSQCSDKDNTESADVDPLCEKRIRRIHKALDSDDVELVKLLLTESEITLDDANALHYAAAYCDPKVVNEVLGLGLADVNLKNSRGYTVLHIAAMRKEPSIIVSLLTKGVCASELTSDGQSAVSICRRLTRPKDYHAKMEQGQETNKDRICIDVLEREMRRNPMAPDASISSQTMADDLHMRLLYLENRDWGTISVADLKIVNRDFIITKEAMKLVEKLQVVGALDLAFARLFFPTEAKLAMDIAHAETTSEFTRLTASKSSNGNFREVDLNETPMVQKKRLYSRMEALMKTVEMGRRYFPHCSEVLDKFMEDDLPEMLYLEKGTTEEQKTKRMRFMELKDDVHKAFNKDKAEIDRMGLSSSSSSSSLKDGVKQKACKL